MSELTTSNLEHLTLSIRESR